MMLINTLLALSEASKMQKGDVVFKRLPHRTDRGKDRTIIIITGRLDASTLAGALAVLEGKADARRHYSKKPPEVEEQRGYIPVRFRREEK